MFLKKLLCVNNVVASCKQFESLYKAVKTVPSVSFRSYSCASSGEDAEISMKVEVKDGSKATSYEVKNVPGAQVGNGKSPFFHKATESLFLVDASAGKIMRYDLKSKELKFCPFEGADNAAFIVPVDGQDNQFIVGSQRNIQLIIWDGDSEKCCVAKTLAKVQEDEKFEKNRFSTGKTDDMGRLFAGTTSDEGPDSKLGEFYMFNGKEAKSLLSNMGNPSGIAINKEGNKLYIVDSAEYTLKEYGFCKSKGTINDPKIIYNWDKCKEPQNLTVPEGIALDADGMVYVGTNAGSIYKIDPCTGTLCMTINLPVRQVTDIAFGGDTLYVTTGSKCEEPAPAGQMFTVTGLGVEGLPSYPFKFPDSNCA